jgi:hypothetical protein
MQAVSGLFRLWLGVIRDAARLFWLAPLIPLIAILPEFVQHVWEVNAGMFASKAAFNALAMDPMRWQFGYFKIAGLVLAMLAAARFWAARRSGQRFFDPQAVAWKAFGLALLINIIVTGLTYLAGQAVPAQFKQATDLALVVVTLPLLPLLVAPLLGISDFTLRRAYTAGWWIALRTAVVVAAWYASLQWLHGFDHKLAMGQPDALVWALMVWDSLVVGLMACVMGTGLHHGFVGKSSTNEPEA